MCGIFCAVHTTGAFSEKDHEAFRLATDRVSYRGPDASGMRQFTFQGASTPSSFSVFLGHRRLSIIDLSAAGNQPMTTGNCHIVYNGEIFNYVEVRRDLEKEGCHFHTGSDTEVILQAYRTYGVQGFSRFNGMWAFCLLDLEKGKLIVSRDRFSIKPLYTCQPSPGVTLFASEIKQLTPFLPQRKAEEDTLFLFLQQSLLDTEVRTLVKGVRRIPPATAITTDLGTGHQEEHRYWKASLGIVSSPEDAEQQFRNLIEDSVRIRLRSDVEVGALLSGGLDSSTLAVIAHRLSAGNFKSFSVISEDRKYSEEPFIDLLVKSCHLHNTKLTFRPDHILASLDTVLEHQHEPLAGLSVVAQYHIFEKIKKETSIRVVLSGQGGDEILMGYLKYYFFNLRDTLKRGRLLNFSKELFGALVHRTVLHQFRMKEARRYLPGRSEGALSFVTLRRPAARPWEYASLNGRQVSDIESFSVPVLAHYEDRNSMAHSIESRLPFLDHRLVEFMIGLPVGLKLKNGWTKYVMRQAMTELPKGIRWRRDKQGFVTPEELWMRTTLQSLIRDEFGEKSFLADSGYIDQHLFLQEYDKFVQGRSPRHAMDFFRVFIAERWAKKVLN